MLRWHYPGHDPHGSTSFIRISFYLTHRHAFFCLFIDMSRFLLLAFRAFKFFVSSSLHVDLKQVMRRLYSRANRIWLPLLLFYKRRTTFTRRAAFKWYCNTFTSSCNVICYCLPQEQLKQRVLSARNENEHCGSPSNLPYYRLLLKLLLFDRLS